jgi:hypothetical protein
MLRNLISLLLYLAVLGALGSIPLILWVGAAVASTRRRERNT